MQFRTYYGIIWKSVSQKEGTKKMMVPNVSGSLEYISEEQGNTEVRERD